jgi:hypothetical protein
MYMSNLYLYKNYVAQSYNTHYYGRGGEIYRGQSWIERIKEEAGSGALAPVPALGLTVVRTIKER